MKKQIFAVLMLSSLLLVGCNKNNGPKIEDLGTKEIHTELMKRYLADEWNSILTYVPWVSDDTGSSSHRDELLGDVSQPLPIKLEFDEVADADNYYVQIAKNADFEDAKLVETNKKSYDFYNSLLGQEYYFRAADSEGGLDNAKVRKFKVSDATPRYIHADGVINFRDVGGWNSSLVEGAKVNQGLYYRCAQFNEGSNKNITAEGLKVIKELGIKVDIDMRDSYNVPSESPINTEEWPVEILKASVASSTEDWRWEGKNGSDDSIAQTYKKIFETIAQADEKPIALHCTHGADRTGIVSYFLMGLVGVSMDDCSRDYVMTRFAGKRQCLPYEDSRASRCEIGNWNSKTQALGGDDMSFADKIYKHLNEDFGISTGTLETIREIFVPGYVRPAAA